jgi:hypothetical protein
MSDDGNEFTIRRKILTLAGAKFHIFDPQGQVIGFCKQKAFKLKEDIRVYSDESMSRELVRIAARAIIDFSAAYDVFDSTSGAKIGAFRRQGFTSMVRDAWSVLDSADREIGQVMEDSTMMALVRRLVPMAHMIPQTYALRQGKGGAMLAEYRTHFNPFVYRLTVKVLPACPVSPHLVLAGGMLIAAIEGRQKQ